MSLSGKRVSRPIKSRHSRKAPLPSPRERSEWREGVGGGGPLARSKLYGRSSRIQSKCSPPTPRYAASPLRSTLPPTGGRVHPRSQCPPHLAQIVARTSKALCALADATAIQII